MAGMFLGDRSLNGVAVAGEYSAAAPRGPAGSVQFPQCLSICCGGHVTFSRCGELRKGRTVF